MLMAMVVYVGSNDLALLPWGRPKVAVITLSDSPCVCGKLRVMPDSVALLCRCPHDRKIAPTSRMSVSFDISFSRTAIKPATTGPQVLSFHGRPRNLRDYLDHSTTAAEQVNDQHHQRDHQQQVNQAARYVEAETKKPQNE